MPMPSSARQTNRKRKVGENPATKLQTEYQRMEIISGFFRPIRSESQPDAVAPSSRTHSVIVKTKVTSVIETLNSCEIGTMINRKMVKSNASSVQPSQAAHQASQPLVPAGWVLSTRVRVALPTDADISFEPPTAHYFRACNVRHGTGLIGGTRRNDGTKRVFATQPLPRGAAAWVWSSSSAAPTLRLPRHRGQSENREKLAIPADSRSASPPRPLGHARAGGMAMRGSTLPGTRASADPFKRAPADLIKDVPADLLTRAPADLLTRAPADLLTRAPARRRPTPQAGTPRPIQGRRHRPAVFRPRRADPRSAG